MSRNRFQRGSGLYHCRVCGRGTRDVGRDGPGVRLCVDCYDGAGYDNEALDEPAGSPERAEAEANARECYQRAVDKGGRIAGYTHAKSATP